jgi:hypothetical protein
LIVVCGERTEKEYFEDFKHQGTPNISIKVRVKAKDPLTQVRFAAQLKESGGFTATWCVFDVDNFDNIPEARAEARRSGVELAISLPCFEYWLILHFADCARHFQAPIEVLKYLTAHHIDGYGKDTPCIEQFRELRRAAVERGRHRHAETGGELVNPSTSVWRLVETVLNEQERRRLKRDRHLSTSPTTKNIEPRTAIMSGMRQPVMSVESAWTFEYEAERSLSRYGVLSPRLTR